MELTTTGFRFRQFTVEQDRCTMKVGTDAVLLGAWVEVDGAKKALDVGTGTGVIAIMLAQRHPSLTVHGVEIDPQAHLQATENMSASPWADRLSSFPDAIQTYAQSCPHSYDLIVSNPPFFTGGVFSESPERQQVRHTVKLPHSDLLSACRKLISPDGTLAVILPLLEGLRFVEMARNFRFYCERMTEVQAKAGKPVNRLLLQFKPEIPDVVRKDTLILQDTDSNTRSDAYRELTDAFYL